MADPPAVVVAGAGAHTDRGRVRAGNEDSHLVLPGLYAVADGMGGHEGGEVASAIAVEALAAAARGGATPASVADALRGANREIRRTGVERPEIAGLGTTCTAVLVADGRAHVAHVGDSRAYLLRDGVLRQLTTDHSLVGLMVRDGLLTPEQALRDERQHVIIRALGAADSVDVDRMAVELAPGDRLLLCSDGLSGPLDDARIARILAQDADPEGAARALVEGGAAEGDDNVTAIVVDLAAATAGAPIAADRPQRSRRGRRLITAVALTVLVAAVAGAVAVAGGALFPAGTNPPGASASAEPTPSQSASPSAPPSSDTQHPSSPVPSAASPRVETPPGSVPPGQVAPGASPASPAGRGGSEPTATP